MEKALTEVRKAMRALRRAEKVLLAERQSTIKRARKAYEEAQAREQLDWLEQQKPQIEDQP